MSKWVYSIETNPTFIYFLEQPVIWNHNLNIIITTQCKKCNVNNIASTSRQQKKDITKHYSIVTKLNCVPVLLKNNKKSFFFVFSHKEWTPLTALFLFFLFLFHQANQSCWLILLRCLILLFSNWFVFVFFFLFPSFFVHN